MKLNKRHEKSFAQDLIMFALCLKNQLSVIREQGTRNREQDGIKEGDY